MPEKAILSSAFLPEDNFLSLASAFQHQFQSGTAGHGLVWHHPAKWLICDA
jgi:hypothetical protein